jgi:hypothetical protein
VGQQLDVDEVLTGYGIQDSEIALAERISREIPAPFMRIDFLRSPDGLVFGEFTRRPGSYGKFSVKFDRWLGDMFLSAEARLFDDALAGQKFPLFESVTSRRNAKEG